MRLFISQSPPNSAINRTLRDKAAQRRLLLRWVAHHIRTIVQRIIYSAIIVAILGLSVVETTYAAEWEVLGTQRFIHFVLVPKARAADRKFFESTARTICGSQKICQIMFWTDRKFAATRTPYSDAQLNRLAAQYWHNYNTGLIELLLPCRIDPNPNQCFK